MQEVKLSDAQGRLPEIIDSLPLAGDVLITQGHVVVARLTSVAQTTLRELTPSSVGAVLRPLARDDDVLGDMLSR